MENNIEEYKKQFKSEELELIVRIIWCWKKGGSDFRMFDNCYIAQARFDKALNVKTGELLETGVAYNWLEWLAPKKKFGFKYSYKFKEGNIYRLLVREYISKENDKFKKYYIEQVLEKSINDLRLDAAYNFESKFEEKVTELTVLVKQRIFGWAVNAGYRIPKAVFIASIDNKTNELSKSHGTLTWIEKGRKSGIKFNFSDMGTYIVKVRKSKENNNSYLLLDVLEKASDERLENIKENYLKLVVINDKLGKFNLDRNYNWFDGKIDYLGDKCTVEMKVEEGETSADIQLNKLKEIFGNLKVWDNHVREYASNELLELANEWCEDEEEITKEEFIRRMGIPVLIIDKRGTVEAMFDSDNMFTDHSIVVDIDENGNFKSAAIEG